MDCYANTKDRNQALSYNILVTSEKGLYKRFCGNMSFYSEENVLLATANRTSALRNI